MTRDVEDSVRQFPHISREFLAWQADPHRRQWPDEMSEEYRDAREVPYYAPSFTTIGRVRDFVYTVIGLYTATVIGLIVWVKYH